MEYKKQKLLLEYLISSPEVFALCMPIIKPEYFTPELRGTANFINQYYTKYNALPAPNQIEAEANIKLQQHEVTKDRVEYCTTEVERFCRIQAMREAIYRSAALADDDSNFGDIDRLYRDALLVGLHRHLGLNYFEDPVSRLQRMLEQPALIPTGWKGIDDALYGGLGRKEITFISGNSGTGKSLTLGNLAFNAVNQHYNCLYITNELDQDTVAQRFDTMTTGIGRAEWTFYVDEIGNKVKKAGEDTGLLDIVYMPPGSTANDVRAYLKEFELIYKLIPDIIIIDYLDRMRPVEHVSADNVFEKDRLATIEARSIGHDYNAAIVTASQLNRESVTAVQHHEGHVAGGISKFNESDVWISIIGKMVVKGEAVYNFLKTRNSDGVGKNIRLEYDNKYLRIRDPKQDTTVQRFVQKVKTKGDITDLMRK